MSDHVFARVSGLGWTLLPLAPFRWEQLPGKFPSVTAVYYGPRGERRASVTLRPDQPEVQLGADTTNLSAVLDLFPGPNYDTLVIETTVFTARWPAGFALVSEPSGDSCHCYLHGPEDALIFVQGPFESSRIPPLNAMAGPEQRVVRAGTEWVELVYQHERRTWRQVHQVVPLVEDYSCVVTAQAPEKVAERTFEAAKELAGSLKPFAES